MVRVGLEIKNIIKKLLSDFDQEYLGVGPPLGRHAVGYPRGHPVARAVVGDPHVHRMGHHILTGAGIGGEYDLKVGNLKP